jgi:hypothetical protein
MRVKGIRERFGVAESPGLKPPFVIGYFVGLKPYANPKSRSPSGMTNRTASAKTKTNATAKTNAGFFAALRMTG